MTPDNSREIAEEAMQATLSMFSNEKFPGFKGKYFDLPARHVLPRLVQQDGAQALATRCRGDGDELDIDLVGLGRVAVEEPQQERGADGADRAEQRAPVPAL